MTLSQRRTCQALDEQELPCRQAPLVGRPYCFWHDPKNAEAVAEARRLGGLRRRREKAVGGAYDFAGLGSVAAVQRLIEIAVVDTLALENSVARSRTLAYLAMAALKALEVSDLEQRLEQLEAAVRAGAAAQAPLFDLELDDDAYVFVEPDSPREAPEDHEEAAPEEETG